MPAYFKCHGYTSLGAGKLWHWGAGPGNNWHENLARFFPTDFQTFIRKERALQNATVTPLDLPDDQYMDAQFAARGIANLRLAKKTLDETGAPFFVAVGFHLPHEPYVFPTWAWQLYDDVKLPHNRGLIQTRPRGMPAYALGDLQAPFSYFNPPRDPQGRVTTGGERIGGTYGPRNAKDPAMSPEAYRLNEVPMPDPMQQELLKGYCASVTFMDHQVRPRARVRVRG